MAFAVCEFHITSHLLCWALRGGATNSPSHALYMGVSDCLKGKNGEYNDVVCAVSNFREATRFLRLEDYHHAGFNEQDTGMTLNGLPM